MARRANIIEAIVKGEADFGRARRDAARDLGRIESEAESTAADIKRAFDRVDLSPELDTADIRQALDLADQLDGMVARLDIDADLEEIQQAEKIARSLRAFQGRVDLSVEGRAELQDALGLADKLDQIRTVKVQVQGQRDLQRAVDLADDVGTSLATSGAEGAEAIGDSLQDIDFAGIGQSGFDQLSGALAAAGPWGAVAAGIGAVFGDELIAGFDAGFNANRQEFMRVIQSGASDVDLERAGQGAGEAWAAGFGESITQLRRDADELISVLGDVGDDVDLGPIVKQAELLSDALGVGVTQSAEQARRAVKQGLARDVQDAFDDMIGVTQEFGDTGREALDVVNEFGPNFARFEVDGGRAVQFVASAFRDGLIPTIDRAGELFEEFTTRIVDADSADAIAKLGLDFEKVQADVARGGPVANAAMQAVIASLIDLQDEQQRAQIMNELFGQSVEQVTDQAELLDRVMGLLTDKTDAYAGSGESLTAMFEAQVTPLDRVQRGVGDLASKYGELTNMSLGWFFDYRDAVDDVSSSLLVWAGLLPETEIGARRMSKETEKAARSTGMFGDESFYAADQVDGLSGEVDDLRGQLERLFDFGSDRLMRDIAESADDLAASMSEVDRSAVGLNGAIDESTTEGRRLESQLETLAGTLIDARVQFDKNEISAYDMATAQARAESAIRNAGNAAGFSQGQIQALIDKYLAAAGLQPLKITVDFDGSFAANELRRFEALSRSGIRIPVSTVGGSRPPSRRRVTRRRVTQRAHGGPTTGMTLVGEEGPELLDLGTQRGFVHNNDDTRRMIASAASSFSGGSGGGGMARQAPVVLEIRSSGSAFDDFLVDALRKAVRNRGSSVVQVI